jgi:DNA helicase II / ATP-dependent DNA helicase PcrA
MAISVQELIDAIQKKNNFPLDPPQIQAVNHGEGPLWLIAGPGTGKTEVLVLRCLKLMCCDGIEPGSIMVTTFTEKAARNLEDRITEALLYIVGAYPQQDLLEIDVSQLRIGTLHSLCNEIMQEFRYAPYRNLRLLDDIDSKMLIRSKVASQVSGNYPQLYQQFRYLFDNKPQAYLWDWTKALHILLNRLVEDQIDQTKLRDAGGVWNDLALVNELYEQTLRQNFLCDFAHLQSYFLDFLRTPQGSIFLRGDGTPQHPPLLHVLVDEYQDTNPIQEQIYFALAANLPHSLTVVGDDDQALYRFRGGTVECMVGFDSQCRRYWNVSSVSIPLVQNHRSDQKIVNWCNEYITSFPQLTQNQARVLGKPDLQCASGRNGNYPAVGFIREKRVARLAASFAETVRGLLANNIIEDYSQCVLLLRSTKDTPRNAGLYIDALKQLNIPVYNPRSKAFLTQLEVQEVLGALISVFDPNLDKLDTVKGSDLKQLVNIWAEAYNTASQRYPDLQRYVEKSQAMIQQAPQDFRLAPAAATILYRIIAHEPFISYQRDPEQDLRLSKITRLFDAFCSQYGRLLSTDRQLPGAINQNWLSNFYYIFCGYLEDQGMDDDEDDEVICPVGKFPIMTIHQSKGLEFDFVFVGSLGGKVAPENAHLLEDNLKPYRFTQPVINHLPEEAAWHDNIRLHFVAYSRARYGLLLLATEDQLKKPGTASFGEQGGTWASRQIPRL